jgi:hypothetical protein
MARPQNPESASINRRDPAAVLADYAAWLVEQPLSARTREAYLAAVTAFVAWLDQRDAGPGEALGAPRARDLAARDYKRHMKVDRGLSPASVNQALAGMDHLFRFLGLGAAIVCREELPGYGQHKAEKYIRRVRGPGKPHFEGRSAPDCPSQALWRSGG